MAGTSKHKRERCSEKLTEEDTGYGMKVKRTTMISSKENNIATQHHHTPTRSDASTSTTRQR